MVKNQIIVSSVVSQGLGVRATAQKYGVSPAWVSTLVKRYRAEGPAAFEPRSKRPLGNSKATPPEVENRIIELRKELLEIGTDAGADTIHTHLEREGFTAPSISTIQRILTRRGFVTPAPKKRPKSSYIRFAAELPNECWQSDMTHWHLEDLTPVEIVTFIDDHSRLVLSIRTFPTTSMENVRRLFAHTCNLYGTPARVLTDNGAIYNAGARGGRTGFESDLIAAGVLYKHSRPYHPAVSRGERNFSVSWQDSNQPRRRPNGKASPNRRTASAGVAPLCERAQLQGDRLGDRLLFTDRMERRQQETDARGGPVYLVTGTGPVDIG